MLFVIDVGNSHTVTGLYDGKTLVGTWRLTSERNCTADELAIRYHALFAMLRINPRDVERVVLASVVPTLETAWRTCCQKYLFAHQDDVVFVVSDTSVSDLITISLPNPAEVGADRLVNAIGGYYQYQRPLVVIDFGTAITFDCVSANCTYLGGAILPGIAISLEALATRTAKLPHIDVSTPPAKIIGKSTVDAMKSGILHGYGAMIDGMVAGLRAEMGEPAPLVLATGGMAAMIATYTTAIDSIEPLLTLVGLRTIVERKQLA